MPDPAVTSVNFFNPADIFSASAWELQSRSPSKSVNRSQGLKANGDEAKSHLYGGQTSDTLTYRAMGGSGAAATLDLSAIFASAVINGWHIDSLNVKYSPSDYTEVTITAHYHDDRDGSRASHADMANKYAPSVQSLPAGFGIPDSLKTLVGISDETIGLSEFSYNMSVQHQDEVGGSGGWLAAEDRDGTETISISTVGVPTAAPAISGWDCTASSSSASNTAAETGSWTFEHHIERTVASQSNS